METGTKVCLSFCVLGFLVCIAILLYLLFNRKKNCEGFKKCTCSSGGGGREKDCQDTEQVQDDYYVKGITETHPRWAKPAWGKISPGDADFPPSFGCGARYSDREWHAWDFTEFGSNGKMIENYSYEENQPYEGDLTLGVL